MNIEKIDDIYFYVKIINILKIKNLLKLINFEKNKMEEIKLTFKIDCENAKILSELCINIKQKNLITRVMNISSSLFDDYINKSNMDICLMKKFLI